MKQKKLFLIMMLMIIATLFAIYLRPTHKIANEKKDFILEKIIPKNFSDWKLDENGNRGIVNPEQEVLINKIYNQTLSRNYVNRNGNRVMLVIAYGDNQSDTNQLHYPEVCYPAQGFQIISNKPDRISTHFGPIRVKKLIASSSNRIEPIIYWTTIGDKVVLGNKETKLEKLKYGLNGEIPDGLLFRVSTISADSSKAYSLELEFINDLIAAVSKKHLKSLSGLNANI